MGALIFILLAFAFGIWGMVRGYRRGLARQTPALIGIAFGIVSARLLASGLEPVIDGALPPETGEAERQFSIDIMSTSLIFAGVYFIFRTVTGFLSSALQRDDRTILDNLGGGLFGLFKYLLWTSIAFNLLLAMRPQGPLLECMKSDDGNVVEEVLLLSPALLGGDDAEDLAHRIQLREARKIS